MASTINLIVLFSGEGTNLENLIQHFHEKRIDDCTVIVHAITNRPEAGGIARCAKFGIEPVVIDHRLFKTREAFDTRLVQEIERYDDRLVVMAGFMRILTPLFTRRVEAINLHPSLLPLFKGARAIEESFKSGMKVGGVTVHRVTEELDNGEILAQRCVPIEENDTLETFKNKIHETEYKLLPATVSRLIKERLNPPPHRS